MSELYLQHILTGRLSLILANVYPNMLDRKLEKRGHRFVHYADNFVIYVKSRRAAECVMEGVKEFIEKDLLYPKPHGKVGFRPSKSAK